MDDPGLWALRLAGMTANVMIVGHLPFMPRLAGLLLCGDQAKTFVHFEPGAIACLERLERGWTIAWMIAPETVVNRQRKAGRPAYCRETHVPGYPFSGRYLLLSLRKLLYS